MVWGVGCGVWGVGCGVWGVGCGVWGVGKSICSHYIECTPRGSGCMRTQPTGSDTLTSYGLSGTANPYSLL